MIEEGKFTEQDVLNIAKRAYKEGVAGFTFTREECALLVIDMQDEFVKPHWTPYWIPEATKIVPRIKKLIEFCRGVEIPVIYTSCAQTYHYKDRVEIGALMPNRYPELNIPEFSFFKAGTIWHEIAPLPDEIVIHKSSYGAFYDTPLETILKNMHRNAIIICGTLTNYCCGTTARQGYERGFKVIFGSDVTATDDPDMQESELMVLRKGFAKVMPAEEIMRSIADPA